MKTVRVTLALLMLPLTACAQVVEQEDSAAVKRIGQGKAAVKTPELPKAEKMIVDQTNAFRKEQGLKAVAVNKNLTRTAEYFAQFMAKNDKYGHTADGNRPADRAKKFDYDYCIVTENIAYQFYSLGFETKKLAEEFVTGWKESPGHRKNMLDPDVTETGVAVAHSEESDHYYAVQMFGRPKSMSIDFQVTNKSDAEVEYKLAERSFPLPPLYSRSHQICRPGEITFNWPNKQDATKVETVEGRHYVIVQQGGRFRLEKE